MKFVKLLKPFKKNHAYQFFFDWFETAWSFKGGKILNANYLFSWNCRMVISKLGLVISSNLFKSPKKALLVLSAGYPSSFSFPFNYQYEIIPFIWDCWPKYWDRLFKFIKRNDVKILFVTSSQVKNMIHEQYPNINVFWIPEGINTKKYNKGSLLINREIDLLELGRVMPQFHQKIIQNELPHLKKHLYGNGNQLLFPDFESLVNGLSQSKLTVCYPRCNTHPEMAGNIETLTQRYWECMLSRTLIVGKAPKELTELIGYNPVVEINVENADDQIDEILEHIASYQDFVDKNYLVAMDRGDWKNRIAEIEVNLLDNGYLIK